MIRLSLIYNGTVEIQNYFSNIVKNVLTQA